MICVYGNGGVGSFGTVSQGMRQATQDCGLLSGYIEIDSQYGLDEYVEHVDAPVALVCGDPGYVNRTYWGHRFRYLVLAPNSNGIAAPVKGFLTQHTAGRTLLDGFLAPSRWAQEILRREFPDHDVLLAPHGVDRQFRYGVNSELRSFLEGKYSRGEFNVLHVTSTATNRKGTKQLLDAWRQLNWRNSTLVILSHPQHMMQYDAMRDGLDSVRVLPTMGMSNLEMYIAYSSVHVVCQPSRAEGFGIVPLEARASGVPVVMTACTGHEQHVGSELGAGVVVVPHLEDAPVEDYPGATAPGVSSDDVARALSAARDQWMVLSRDSIRVARPISDGWAWNKQNETAIRQLSDKAKENQ